MNPQEKAVFSEEQLAGKSWQQIARMAHKKWKAQTERSPYSMTTLMMQTIGPALRAGFEGTMTKWCQTIVKPPSQRAGESTNPPTPEPASPPTPEPVEDDLDAWLDEL